MKKHGNLFVFEGPDGGGKSTLSLALVQQLQAERIDCEYVAFPGNRLGTLGKLVHDLHHNPTLIGVEALTPSSLQLLHMAAHVDAIESRILPALKYGRTVVLDRFWWSTWVYGKISGVKVNSLKAMIRIEGIAWRKIKPTTIFLIRTAVPRDTHRIENYDRLAGEYKNLAIHQARHVPVRIIENNSTIDEAMTEILSSIEINKGYISNGPVSRYGSHKKQNQPEPAVTTFSTGAPLVFARFSPAKPTIVFETFWRFAAERQEIFFRRLAGEPPPWTSDPILSEYKFTNVYRASDRVSQYLIKNVIYDANRSREETFFRTLLFKFFNRIETWELLKDELETISYSEYSFERYDSILSQAMSKGRRIYSAAYIMPSGGASSTVSRKHQMHLKLLEHMMRDELPTRLGDTSSMGQAFDLLRSYPTLGDFLAYQYVTDLNYSKVIDFTEMQFVVPGPGARDGIRKCFSDLGGLNESEIIKWVAEHQEMAFDALGLEFRSLWGRALQLIDCQSLFCEVDKYARINHPEVTGITGRTRIKQRYKINRDPISVWYPPKWGLNERIAIEDRDVSSF